MENYFVRGNQGKMCILPGKVLKKILAGKVGEKIFCQGKVNEDFIARGSCIKLSTSSGTVMEIFFFTSKVRENCNLPRKIGEFFFM